MTDAGEQLQSAQLASQVEGGATYNAENKFLDGRVCLICMALRGHHSEGPMLVPGKGRRRFMYFHVESHLCNQNHRHLSHPTWSPVL